MGLQPPLLQLENKSAIDVRSSLSSCSDSVRLPSINPKVHGPYDPAVYYGPKHTPLGEVKVGELPGWLAQRDKSITGIGRAVSRGYWRYCHAYVFPKRTKIAPVVHFFLGASVLFYVMNYQKMKHHRRYKYHW